MGQKQITLSQLDADSEWGWGGLLPPNRQKITLHEWEKRDPWTPVSRAAQEGDTLVAVLDLELGGEDGPRRSPPRCRGVASLSALGLGPPSVDLGCLALPTEDSWARWPPASGLRLRSSLPSAAGPVTPQTPAPEALPPAQASEPMEPLPVFIPRGGPGSLAWAGPSAISWPPWKWLGSRS